MTSSINNNNNSRLNEIKIKPKIGEVRLTNDGTRRKIYTGTSWQYLCQGDPNCRIQAKSTCRNHRNSSLTNNTTLNQLSKIQIKRPKRGDTQILPNGNRRIWRGERWQNLCRADNCLIQAKDFCKLHQNQRMSLPNTNQKSRLSNRTRSYSLTSQQKDEHEHIESNNKSSSSIQDNISFQSPNNKHHQSDENIFETVTISPLRKRELHTRHGRRVRCNGLIWKHLCADKKNNFNKRKSRSQNISIKESNENISNHIESLLSDTIDTSIKNNTIIEIKNSKKRKTTGDINNEEHIVPKRKSNRRHRKGSNKSITLHLETNSSSSSISDIPMKEKSIEEPISNESDITLSLKSNQFDINDQSIEIPIQSSSPPPFIYDTSTSAILEQFGTIIKKEEEESLICIPPIHTNGIESPCETLQDFLRVEEMKKKEFKLDCQRISYRLAKIQDCIGSISSMTS
ncbi:unnamed protein product [Rotaria sordida]|uniref:Uncharacterized protein n=1 Tax=Rotaria sordida TaxID=392033 RepID=A0A814C561_9BILA|nr:unnamed protein product [Rotaria sordida]